MLIVGLLFFAVMAKATASQSDHHSELRSVQVKDRSIVIRGAYLSRVEVWAVPTGTGITPSEFEFLGNAKQTNSRADSQRWVFSIPSCETDTRLLATEIFAKGFNEKGKNIGTKSLPYFGASAVHDALCGTH